jgi:hypothetical protein
MPHGHRIAIKCECARNNFVKDRKAQIYTLLAQPQELEFNIIFTDVIRKVPLIFFKHLVIFLPVKDFISAFRHKVFIYFDQGFNFFYTFLFLLVLFKF